TEEGALDTGAAPEPARVAVSSGVDSGGPAIAVLVVPARARVTRELLGAAAELAADIGGWVAAIGPGLHDAEKGFGPWGADEQINIANRADSTSPVEEDAAAAISSWAAETRPWAVLAPGTAWGREVASRMAASLGAGLTGDAVGLKVDDAGRLIAMKPAFGGWLVAEIGCSSPVQMATVRPGVLPLRRPNPDRPPARWSSLDAPGRSRLEVVRRYRDDDSGELANASVVIGVGQGVDPADYPELEKHRAAIGAALCATRKVTDHGWMPRARQVGITGHSISPRLYLAVGTSGKFNHTVGVRNAGTVVGVNPDPDAPLWDVADIGFVGAWAEVLDALIPRLAEAQAG
ncbi:MAG: electron transfer flavoprotein subunit alpha/FixB family protein, partial [bacterium]|nr:electron transfer flavoprotein subunit alpha/FixB family protein [bacterium]